MIICGWNSERAEYCLIKFRWDIEQAAKSAFDTTYKPDGLQARLI